MDSSEVTQLIIIGILLLLSAFFSSAETAFTTVNKLRIRSLAEENNRKAKLINKLIENPSKMLSAIVIGNTLVNLSAVSIATAFAVNRFHSVGAVIVIGILVLFILIFCEVIPKSIATIHSEKLSFRYVKVINFLIKLLTPLIFVMNKISQGILLLIHINPGEKVSTITEDELRSIVDVSHEEGVIESEERRMINNVVDFGDSLAKDVMVPRIDMVLVEDSLTYDEVVELYSVDKYTRMPVYDETIDNIIGIINIKDLFFFSGKKENFSIQNIMREPYYTYEYKKTSELFLEMRKDSIPMAIVLDEYGSTAGLITLEDLLEEIVGEIRDEYDFDEEDCIKCIGENEYIVDGNTKLDDINEAFHLDIESDDYDSIAGHIIFLLDHLPEVGETITDQNVVYTIQSLEKNRIDKIHVLITAENEADEEEIL
ncbi:hemolysin family protein [Anaerocolumna aminovalerica]|uniref:Hemolysin, contains CBS domains n=1 Tax=Anaerocolumna aminovalerica TaxID=1527 RepID=A0A1I5GF08_9FIRM|nr:hemolysin family protein [Anaerocolumna aminovalerica]MBU5331949.1 hemolysin family protein [Anaerocolumna aminovalerica]MDU6264543.1 hemolysin family protein [Anaerocolumna aminovalerica]SFO34487.1 Hemolysin, contains CBS domains [Anaerocolumna aminovalerica]